MRPRHLPRAFAWNRSGAEQTPRAHGPDGQAGSLSGAFFSLRPRRLLRAARFRPNPRGPSPVEPAPGHRLGQRFQRAPRLGAVRVELQGGLGGLARLRAAVQDHERLRA